ncbi:MAG: formate dehydrogenase accessory sulfurtransferase FdhD [Mannheimia varigena]|uniref:formate dehydrogenase accessory sulfurtransferase FdhD n=1 Tax=Mannheimia varigena TaxID=85404 RepID=UPI001107205D|nr:formate dehydrogenase accessory sulfurtransferase FdhD [Mannheimia varigena]MDY2948080.1 formate dehydrogenase accessory sulfurtransferase FdhD [Mannheimia varigena]TLU75397.1 formate dehydrogenase accessory sulfurtransferase FdhD [Mannheimia varigena]
MNKITKIDAKKLLFSTTELKQQNCEDNLISEVPVALVYNGISHTVMMTTPSDLDDFALGFSLAEGILNSPQELYGLDVIEQENGVEIQLEISTRQFVALKDKRRSMAGRTGCGICGVEQLEQVNQSCKIVKRNNRLQGVNPLILESCLEQLENAQILSKETGASHAAAFFSMQGELLAIREDVGRHVALDKLIGWYAKASYPNGFVFVTSRASFEMVQKCLAVGIEMLCAISATTEMAVKMARDNQFTLLAFTRKGKSTIYSGEERLSLK